VLACVAEYNSFFGQRFDELFRDAARQIKSFAHKVQEEGGSVLTRVEGDISVKNLADIEESSLLEQEYDGAKAGFQKVSKYKKVVDSRHKRPEPHPAPATPPPTVAPVRLGSDVTAAAPARAMTNTIEEGKLKSMDETIGSFVRASAAKTPSVIPLRNCNLPITPAEVETFRSDFGNEKSFRADYAALHRRIVVLYARMVVEHEEFKNKEGSAYLWKPHADALTYLLTSSQRALEASGPLTEVAEQRGLAEKITALNASLQKLRWEMQRAIKTLEGLTTQKPAW
jgi:hypothetical protein